MYISLRIPVKMILNISRYNLFRVSTKRYFDKMKDFIIYINKEIFHMVKKDILSLIPRDFYFRFPRPGLLNVYHIRNSIVKALESNLDNFKGDFLDLGCGKMPYRNFLKKGSDIKSYTGVDIENCLEYDLNVKPDMYWDGETLHVEDQSYNSVLMTEVLEHCFTPSLILEEVQRVMKPDGFLLLTVPFLWPLHEEPHDYYRYTPYSMRRFLEEAGFKDIHIKKHGGLHAAMSQIIAFWLYMLPVHHRIRRVLSYLLTPFILILCYLDKLFDKWKLDNRGLFTGMSITARK